MHERKRIIVIMKLRKMGIKEINNCGGYGVCRRFVLPEPETARKSRT